MCIDKLFFDLLRVKNSVNLIGYRNEWLSGDWLLWLVYLTTIGLAGWHIASRVIHSARGIWCVSVDAW